MHVYDYAIQCALICVGEMINTLLSIYNDFEEDEVEEFGGELVSDKYIEYWEEVEMELELNKINLK